MNGWNLPELQTIAPENVQSLIELVRIGGGSIHDLTYSPDGQFLIAASSIGVWVYDETQDRSFSLGKNHYAYTVDCSADSRWIGSVLDQNQLYVWDVETEQVLAHFNLAETFNGIQALVFHPQKPLLAVGGWDEQVHVFDLEEKHLNFALPCSEPVNSLAFHPNGRHLAVGGWKGDTDIWDIDRQTKISLPRLRDNQDCIQVAFSPRGDFAYGCGGIVSLWNLENQSEIRRFVFGGQSLQDITFDSKGTTLATANWAGAHSGPGHIRTFDLTSGSERIVSSDGGVSVAFRLDNQILAYAKGGWNSTIEFCEIKTGKRFFMPNHGSIAIGLAITSDSRTVAYGRNEGTIHLADVKTGEEKAKLQKESYDRRSASGGPIAFYPDDNTIIFEGLDRGTQYYAWNITTNDVVPIDLGEQFFFGRIMASPIISPKSGKLILGAWNQTYLLGQNYLEELLSHAHEGLTFDVALTNDDKVLVESKPFRTVSELSEPSANHFNNGENLEIQQTKQGWNARSISVSNSGNFLATGGRIGSGNGCTAVGWLWNLEENELSFAFKTQVYYGAEINHALITPNESLAVFADTSGDIFVWDIQQSKQLLYLHAHTSNLWNMAISPDGKLLITVGSDGTLRIWGIPVTNQ